MGSAGANGEGTVTARAAGDGAVPNGISEGPATAGATGEGTVANGTTGTDTAARGASGVTGGAAGDGDWPPCAAAACHPASTNTATKTHDRGMLRTLMDVLLQTPRTRD
jgi:hypothetical protein